MSTTIAEDVARIFGGGAVVTQDPYPLFARVREEAPFLRAPVLGPSPDVHVTRCADVYPILRDPRFSNEDRTPPISTLIGGYLSPEDEAAVEAFDRTNRLSMLEKDPPDHTRLRRLVAKAFTPRGIERQRPMIQAIVDDLLAEAGSEDGVDFMRAVAAPLPAQVIAAMLGVPREDWAWFKEWSDGSISFNMETVGLTARHWQRLDSYFRELVCARQEEPRDDLISALVRARDERDALTEDEVVAQCIMLLVGGHETTTFALGSALATLANRPKLWRDMRERPDLVPGVVEECLRLESPFQFNSRVVNVDLEICGQPIRKGEVVWLWVAAANRDPRQFDRPDAVDPRRANGRHLSHLAFGGGIHYCLGAALAQLELRTTLATLTQRYPDFRVADAPVRWQDNVLLRGPSELRVRFGNEARE